MRDFKWYKHGKACAPFALLQLTDKSENDVLQACIIAGYKPEEGGMEPNQFAEAARILGIEMGHCYSTKPNSPLTVGHLALGCPEGTFVVGVKDHVFVVKDGRPIDSGCTLPWEKVLVLWPVGKEDPFKGAQQCDCESCKKRDKWRWN